MTPMLDAITRKSSSPPSSKVFRIRWSGRMSYRKRHMRDGSTAGRISEMERISTGCLTSCDASGNLAPTLGNRETPAWRSTAYAESLELLLTLSRRPGHREVSSRLSPAHDRRPVARYSERIRAKNRLPMRPSRQPPLLAPSRPIELEFFPANPLARRTGQPALAGPAQ
jgi:hypothetical protein